MKLPRTIIRALSGAVRGAHSGMAPAAGDVPANVSGPTRLFNWNKSVFFTAARLVYPGDVKDIQAVRSSNKPLRVLTHDVAHRLSYPCHVPTGHVLLSTS